MNAFLLLHVGTHLLKLFDFFFPPQLVKSNRDNLACLPMGSWSVTYLVSQIASFSESALFLPMFSDEMYSIFIECWQSDLQDQAMND